MHSEALDVTLGLIFGSVGMAGGAAVSWYVCMICMAGRLKAMRSVAIKAKREVADLRFAMKAIESQNVPVSRESEVAA